MPRPVFPVVRLPYDQPDRVARVLDTVRRELRASRRPTATTAPSLAATCGRGAEQRSSAAAAAMTARVQLLQAREPEKMASAEPTAAPMSAYVDQTLDQVTVGVRDCTLTPKTRPEITVTAGGVSASRNSYRDKQQSVPPSSGAVCGGGSPYLLVPPVNITAEISRPPPASLHQFTAATS